MSKKALDAERMDAENPEWTEADIKSAVRFDALRTSLQHKLRRQHGPQKAPRNVQTSAH